MSQDVGRTILSNSDPSEITGQLVRWSFVLSADSRVGFPAHDDDADAVGYLIDQCAQYLKNCLGVAAQARTAQFERVHAAADHKAHVVSDELPRVMVREHTRILLEKRALLR